MWIDKEIDKVISSYFCFLKYFLLGEFLWYVSCFRAASHLFPYVKKRIQVISQTSTELNPIEVAIDEMSKKVSELNQLCTMEEVDMIRLQLKLQGSVSVKVMTICLFFFFFLMHLPKFLFWYSSFQRCFLYFIVLVISRSISVQLKPALKK